MGVGLTVTATLVAILLTSFYIFLRRLRSYWSRRNVPTVAENVFYGVHKKTINLVHSLAESNRAAYEAHKDKRYFGTYFFGKPILVVTDHEIIKHILVKDFPNFNSHGFYNNPEKDPLSGHLFNLDGAKWKAMRSMLTVTFTSGKLKYMFHTIQESINHLYEVIGKEIEEKGNVTNMRDKLGCLGTDIIASVAFGIEAKSLENPDFEFRETGRLIFSPTFREFMRNMVLINAHWAARLFGIRVACSRAYNFVMDMVKTTVEYREKNNVQRNDFLNLLIQLKNNGFVEGEGKEATSGAATDNAETLRSYPPIGTLLRASLQQCKLPTTDVIIDKGTPIALPVFGLHMDPEYYPDPEKFDPERFSEEQKALRPPYTYLPFGEGPRICIGMKLGLLQVKSVLLCLLARYNFDLTKDTPNPIKLDPRCLVTTPTKLDFVVTKRSSTVL